MNKIWKYIQYAYLVIGIIFAIEGVLRWNINREKSYLMFGFAIFIILIFFFKRNFRKKIAQQNKQSKK